MIGRTHSRSLPARLEQSNSGVGHGLATSLCRECVLNGAVATSRLAVNRPGDQPSEDVSDDDPSHASVRLPQSCDQTHPDTFNLDLWQEPSRTEKKSELSRLVSNTGCKWSAVIPEGQPRLLVWKIANIL